MSGRGGRAAEGGGGDRCGRARAASGGAGGWFWGKAARAGGFGRSLFPLFPLFSQFCAVLPRGAPRRLFRGTRSWSCAAPSSPARPPPWQGAAARLSTPGCRLSWPPGSAFPFQGFWGDGERLLRHREPPRWPRSCRIPARPVRRFWHRPVRVARRGCGARIT